MLPVSQRATPTPNGPLGHTRNARNVIGAVARVGGVLGASSEVGAAPAGAEVAREDGKS